MQVINRNRIYLDQKGRFPYTARLKHQYLVVIFLISPNAILVEPLKNRTKAELVWGYNKRHPKATKRGFTITLTVLDNKIPKPTKMPSQ